MKLVVILCLITLRATVSEGCGPKDHKPKDPEPLPRTADETADIIGELSVNRESGQIERIWPEDIYYHNLEEMPFKPLLFSGSAHGLVIDPSSWILEADRILHMFNSLDQSPGSPITHMGIKFGNGPVNVFECNPDGSGQAIFCGEDWVTPGYNVYEIRIRLPKQLCPGQLASEGYCANIPIRFYAMWFTGGADARQAHSSTVFEVLPVDVFCSSSCAAEPGTPCAWANQCQRGCSKFGYKSEPSTPSVRNRQITRRYDVGVKEGSIAFNYTTGSSKDRMAIFHDNKRIMDSGCTATGAGLWNFIRVPFKGESTAIRVDVEPNCDASEESFLEDDYEFSFPQIGTGSTVGTCLN